MSQKKLEGEHKLLQQTNRLLTSINGKLDTHNTKQTESNTLKQQILGKMNILEELLKQNPQPPKPTKTTRPPQTDQWSNLPWRPYKTGGGGWIFATNQDGTPNTQAQSLINALNQNDGKVTTSHAEYKFSGQNNKFISRTPR